MNRGRLEKLERRMGGPERPEEAAIREQVGAFVDDFETAAKEGVGHCDGRMPTLYPMAMRSALARNLGIRPSWSDYTERALGKAAREYARKTARRLRERHPIVEILEAACADDGTSLV